MKKFLMLLTLFLAFVCVVGCGGRNDKEIRIGNVGPLTGTVAVYGKSVKKGAELAVEEINAAGGVNINGTKRLINYVGFDNDEASSDKSKSAFNSLYDKGIDFLIGAVTSGATEGLITEAVQVGIPVLTPTGTADSLTVGAEGDERAQRSNVFRTCYTDTYQGEAIAKYAIKKEFKKVAVLYNSSDDYSTGLANVFEKACKAAGMTVDKQGYTKDIKNFDSYFSTDGICNAKYDALFLPDYYETVKVIIDSARKGEFTNPILGGDGWDGILTIDGIDVTKLEGCYFANHFALSSDKEVVKNFVAKFKEKYNEDPNSFAALAYDSVYIMAAAMEKAGTTEYAKVVAVLADPSFKVECVTGTISFDKNGNPNKEVTILTFKNGKMEVEEYVKAE